VSSLPIRLAFAATPQAAAEAVSELRNILARAEDCDMEPVFVPSYAALYDAIHLHDADVAWCPPLVARDLQRDGAAEARLCIIRNGAASYFSAIVGGPTLHAPTDIKRFGWVSRMSGSGYLIPRSYLSSIGVDMTEREERFFHTHGRSMSALEAGVVDAIATYAVRINDKGDVRVPHAFAGARILATMGPIPGDVIMLAHSIAPARAQAMCDAMRAAKLASDSAITAMMGATAFGDVPPNHLESLGRWIAHPVFSRVS
jgi:ABC-type phosphate/phosphonate transport system substrate-binding protein